MKPTQDLQAAFKAAVAEMSKQKAVLIKPQGLPECYRLAATADDVITGSEIIDAMKERHGDQLPKAASVAVRAAQVICDADGKRLFDPNSLDDLKTLAALPWETLSDLAGASDEKKN